ncbi:MAG TPA: DUF3883 domain-containing protein [Pirellulales bacterium]|nr:DUF3883 domain-containing protein [Pirellulales bacterium]
MTTSYRKKLIEVALPLVAINAASAREKSIRHGHLSTLYFASPTRSLDRFPRDASHQKWGYDVESAIPNEGRLRFIEVKGRALGAETVTITKNEILTGLNKPDDFILAIGLISNGNVELRYVRRPFGREPDFGVTSVNYDLDELLARAKTPS